MLDSIGSGMTQDVQRGGEEMDQSSQQTLVELLHGQRTAALGTLRDGAPLVSMVLYAMETDLSAFYIHVSSLAHHTDGLTENNRVSLLIAQPDDGNKDPQTLARISIQGRAEAMERGTRDYVESQALYLARHPQATMNFQLGDFALYRIVPSAARYVAGFGRIFNLSRERLAEAGIRR
jgi:putative heme iron utilization protein